MTEEPFSFFNRKLKCLRIFLLKTGLHNLPKSFEEPVAIGIRVIKSKRKGPLIGERDTAQFARRHIWESGEQRIPEIRFYQCKNAFIAVPEKSFFLGKRRGDPELQLKQGLGDPMGFA